MCGIFGWLGKDPKDFNKDKFDKLGIYNVDRGRSSCGISYDGEIYIGLDKNKLYYDFILENEINPVTYPVVIGHTRQSSVGAVNEHNAHPFGFDVNNDDTGFKFIGCHNGTLSNHESLAKKYLIDLTASYEFTTVQNNVVESVRTKIDSEILLEILHKTKSFKVLSEYIGGAALYWTDTDNPNVAYLWKGASRTLSTDKPNVTVVERPLFVYRENSNSMYISSLDTALKSIADDHKNIYSVAENTVHIITNGDFINSKKIKISRKNAYQKEGYTAKNSKYPNYGYGYGGYGYDVYDDYDACDVPAPKKEVITLPAATIESKIVPSNIYNETTLKSLLEYGDKIYFNKLRFYRKTMPITGVYTWIPNFGYYYLSDNAKEATDLFYFNADKVFNGKSFELLSSTTDNFVPFRSNLITNPTLFYFVEGVNLRTNIDYSIAYNKFLNKSEKYLDFRLLSSLATHPVIDINRVESYGNTQNILLNGKSFSGQICPLGSEKKYTIQNGNLISSSVNTYGVPVVTKEDSTKEEPVKDAWDDTQFIDSLDDDADDLLLAHLIEVEEAERELIIDILNEDLSEPLCDFQRLKSKLNKYESNELAAEVIDFIDESLKTINNLLKI
jgi:predicted glutamine amidotransferase